jgi:hypothetical protein
LNLSSSSSWALALASHVVDCLLLLHYVVSRREHLLRNLLASLVKQVLGRALLGAAAESVRDAFEVLSELAGSGGDVNP